MTRPISLEAYRARREPPPEPSDPHFAGGPLPAAELAAIMSRYKPYYTAEEEAEIERAAREGDEPQLRRFRLRLVPREGK